MSITAAIEISGWQDVGLPTDPDVRPPGTTRLMKDGQYIWAYPKADGRIEFVRFGRNEVDDFVAALDLIEE